MQNKKYNLICFGFLPWSSMWKRNQSMMGEMAKFDWIDKVIFVNPDISLRQVIKQGSNTGSSEGGSRLFPQEVHPDVWQYTPLHLLPVTLQNRFVEKFESRHHLNRLRRLNNSQPYILFMNCPNIRYPYPLDNLLEDAALSVFDLSDDFIELVHRNQAKAFYKSNIETYAKAADVVLAVNDYLKNKYVGLSPDIYVVKNATNFSNFDRKSYTPVPFLETVKDGHQIIIGYSGLCNITRIDVALLDFLLGSRPDWQFVFVGSKGEELAAHVGNRVNFHHLPAVNYERLPDHLNYFDVTIVPFKICDHTRGNNLLKFHDYLAMGKPVVTTNIGGAEDLKDVVSIAGGPADFLAHIENALADDSAELIQVRKRVAFDNSWPNRIKEVEKILIDRLRQTNDSTTKRTKHMKNDNR